MPPSGSSPAAPLSFVVGMVTVAVVAPSRIVAEVGSAPLAKPPGSSTMNDTGKPPIGAVVFELIVKLASVPSVTLAEPALTLISGKAAASTVTGTSGSGWVRYKVPLVLLVLWLMLVLPAATAVTVMV